MGLISESHARVIVLAIDTLPAAIAAEHDLAVEATLVEHALVFDPLTLRKVAVKLADVLDPDGSLPTDTTIDGVHAPATMPLDAEPMDVRQELDQQLSHVSGGRPA